MKKITTIFMASALTISVFAQNGAVTNAVLYHKEKQYDKAKEAIDGAVKHEKTSTKSKTWYYSGLIYMDMAKSQEDLATKHDYFSSANIGFQKAIDLNNSENFVGQATKKREELYGTVFNQGVAMHEKKDLENAMKFDELASDVQIDKTENRVNALINASIAAGALGKTDKAIELNKKILVLAPNDVDTYLELILLHDKKDDVETALKYAEEGSSKFQSDNRFNNEVARLAIKSGKAEEAIVKLKAASDRDPKNTLFLNKIAELYDQMGNKKDAEVYYKKAVEVDENNVDANYNLGAFYFNEAVDYINKLNNLDLNANPKERKSLTDNMKASFNKCIPFYEKAYPQLTEAEKQGLKPSLMKAYIKVGRDADADKL